MTAKKRHRKVLKRLRKEERLSTAQKNETYSFYKNNKVVEVVAPSLEEAKQKFMFTHGFWPDKTVQEY